MPDILTTELTFGPFSVGIATETNTGIKRRLIWIVDSSGGVADNPFANPTITQTSTPGTNPPTWSFVMPDLQVGDRIQLDFTSNGSAPDGVAEETHDPVTSDEAILGDISWSTFTGFAGSSTVKWRQRYGRTINGTQIWSAWSNTLSDVVNATAFDPATLFGGADVGYVWNPTDLTHVWQGAGTTAGAFTSPVGRLDDLSGLANNINAKALDTSRPTLVNVNNGMVSFDGSNDKLIGTSGFYAKGAMTLVAAIKGLDTSARILWAENSSSNTTPIYSPGVRGNATSTGMLNFQTNDAAATINHTMVAALLDNTTKIAFITDNGSTVSISIAGGAFVTDAYTRSGVFTLNQSSFGTSDSANANIGGFATFNLGAGIAIGRLLTGTLGTAGTERTNAYNWIAALHGLTQL